MPLTITKKKAAKKVKAKVEASQMTSVGAVVDAAGKAQDAWKEVDAKAKELKKVFDGYSKEFYKFLKQGDDTGIYVPEDNPSFHGEEYAADASKLAVIRSIEDTRAVFLALENVKEGLALELMQFKLGDLDKYLTADQIQALVVTDHATKRKVTFSKLAEIKEK